MQELEAKPFKPSPLGRSTEVASLGGILNLVNTPEFSTDDGPGLFSKPPKDPIPTAQEQQQQQRTPAPEPAPAAPAEQKVMPDRIFTTGRLRSGKDFVLKRLGYVVHGFADPLYSIQEYFFHTKDKTLPGARKFLQQIGQWGRGQVDEKYPLTSARAALSLMIRTLGPKGMFGEKTGVDWSKFGISENIWLDAFLARFESATQTAGRNAVSNVRFQNEYDGLTRAGWVHFHVMCSPDTWAKRLKEAGLTPASPELKDFSETLAAALDTDALQRAKLKPRGSKLRVIWNDPSARCPSPRFYTLDELG